MVGTSSFNRFIALVILGLQPSSLFACAAIISQFSSANTAARYETHLQIADMSSEMIKQKVREWVRSRLPNEALQDGALNKVLSSSGSWTNQGLRVEVIDINDDKDAHSRNLFALRFERPDADNPRSRKWIAELTVVTSKGQNPNLGLRLFVNDTPQSDLPPPGLSVPKIISQLMSGNMARSSQFPLQDKPLLLTHNQIKKFADSLRDPQRRLPVIYISRTSQNQTLVNAESLAYRFRGRAIVVVESADDRDSELSITDALKLYLPKEFLAYGGAVRIYSPDLNPNDPQDALKHRFMDPRQILELGPQGVMSQLGRLFDRQRIQNPTSQNGTTIEEIFTILRTRQLAEIDQKMAERSREQAAAAAEADKLRRPAVVTSTLKPKAETSPQPNKESTSPPAARATQPPTSPRPENNSLGPAKDLEAEAKIAELTMKLKALEDLNASLNQSEALAHQKISILQAQIESLNSRIQNEVERAKEEASTWRELGEEQQQIATDLRIEVENLKKRIQAMEASKVAPKFSDRLQEASEKYSETLTLHPNAFSTAKDNFEGKAKLQKNVLEMIDHIGTHLHTMHFGPTPSRNKVQDFNNLSRFELTEWESDTTMNNERLKRLRTIDYKGKRVVAQAHVKYGNTPGNQVRIHYWVDSIERKIVITHIVDHLEIASTN